MVLCPRIHQQEIPRLHTTHRLNVLDGVGITACTRKKNHSSSSKIILDILSLHPLAGGPPPLHHPQIQCSGWCWHCCLHKKAESIQQFLEYQWYSVPSSISRRSPAFTPPTTQLSGWCLHYCLHKKEESFCQNLEYPWYSVPASISRRYPASTPPTDSM